MTAIFLDSGQSKNISQFNIRGNNQLFVIVCVKLRNTGNNMYTDCHCDICVMYSRK